MTLTNTIKLEEPVVMVPLKEWTKVVKELDDLKDQLKLDILYSIFGKILTAAIGYSRYPDKEGHTNFSVEIEQFIAKTYPNFKYKLVGKRENTKMEVEWK